MDLLTNLLSIYLPALIIIILLLKKPTNYRLLAIFLLSFTLNYILKETFKIRGTPNPKTFNVSEYNFPSLTAQLSLTFWGYLFWYYKKYWFLILAIAIPLLVSYLKLAARQHSLQDVLGGLAMAIIIIAVFNYFEKIFKKSSSHNVYDDEKKWTYYLTRPFDLFGTSLWQAWYESKYFKEILGREALDVLCIEEPKGHVKQYRPRKQFLQIGSRFLKLLLFNKKKYKELLIEAEKINEEAKILLEKNYLNNFEQAFNFWNKLGVYATLIPNIPSLLTLSKFVSKQNQNSIEHLRNVSYYPDILKKVVLPLAIRHLKNSGVERAEELIPYITVKELLANKKINLVERKEKTRQGYFFVYQNTDKNESINWVLDPTEIIQKIDKKQKGGLDRVKGSTAYPGCVRGVIKFVKDYDSAKSDFKEGSILLAISTNPTVLPLMKKSIAIITDEGGITSHAAIISRELKIPCIIGAKNATKTFKDGDFVEADATRGIARKLA